MSPANRRCLWCGENHPTELIRIWGDLATTCPKLGANETMTASWADLVAAVRLVDGSQVVAFAAPGLEVKAFGAEDLDERGMPLEKT